jgi:hypothetical protein
MDPIPADDSETPKKYNVPPGTAVLRHEFVLVSDADARELREKNSVDALKKLGLSVKLLDGLPVPDLD